MKENMSSKKRKHLSVDAFMEHGLDSDGDESDSSITGSREDSPEPVQQSKKNAAKQHKASLEKLKEQDPEFYEFLKNEDKELLSFNPDDISDSSGSEDDSEDEQLQRGPRDLEVATDSEDESDDGTQDTAASVKGSRKTLVTMKMINQWSKSLSESDSLQALHQSVSAFRAAVHEAGSDDGEVASKYKVEGSSVFNAIVRLCITDVYPMLTRVLKLPQKKESQKPVLPSSSNKWKRVKTDVKSYLTDMLQFITDISEPAILNVVLKHMHQLVTFYACFLKLTKTALKKLVGVWSGGEETSRVLAFLSISKLTRLMQDSMLDYVIKQLYMAYVKNCKFTSPNTLPLINFMQRSLVEILVLDMTLTYQYAFIYIRQLAIHLRNAITVKKKETCQSVYNWQYIHSMHLWVRLLSQVYPNETLEPLIYPLTQVIIGTVKLIPTARYYPLRFHCVKMLNMLSDSTHTFIPTLPFITEVLELTDFNKKHKSAGWKPFNFACILKMSKAQMEDKSFRDGIVDQVYDLLLESFAIHAHSIGFPELALPAVIQIKAFLKKCKIANYTKVIKQLLDKVQETSKLITQRRKTACLKLTDNQGIEAWERRSKDEGTPLQKHYTQYKKRREVELQQEISGKDRISTDDLPTIDRRPRVLGKASDKERKEFKGLFESDSDADTESDDETRFLLKNERPKKKQKTKKKSEDPEDSDLYSDFDEDELAALDHSASEDDDENEEKSGENESDSEGECESETELHKDNDMEKDSVDLNDISDEGDVLEDFSLSDSELE